MDCWVYHHLEDLFQNVSQTATIRVYNVTAVLVTVGVLTKKGMKLAALGAEDADQSVPIMVGVLLLVF